MRFVSILIITIVVLLSVAAGLAKVMEAPQELEFLQSAGLSTTLIIIFGLIQIAAAVLLVPRKTRMAGSVLAALAFAVSSVLIFVAGNLGFGLFSLLPVLLACVIIYQTSKVA